MKKLKKIKAQGFYVFQGRSNANSCFIEKLCHAKKFLVYANYFLKDYLSIYDYLISKDGWSMVVKIKPSKQIMELDSSKEKEVWSIISERVRLFLSTFVRTTNRLKGRTGSLVHSGYERYQFESKKEAMKYLSNLRNRRIKLYSKKKKYRGLKTHYRIPSNITKGSVFLCSRDIRKKKKEMLDFREVISFTDLTDLIVEKLVNFTQKLDISSFQDKST